MRHVLRARLLASALVVSAIPIVAASVPAYAQVDVSIGFDSFQNQLAPYGYWLYSDRWGVVWQPTDVPDDFRPYFTGGHWVDTEDYGLTWISDYDWGDIPFHYGRWVNDPDDGWLWIPGYVWSPGWVVWRTNDQYMGWMPMPPDDAFLEGRGDVPFGVSFRFGLGDIGGFYGYSRWYGPAYDEDRFAENWVFVGLGHIADRDYRPFVVDRTQVVNIIHTTRNITNYSIVNNHVVNRSIDVRVIERASGHPIPVVRAAAVIRHPNLITTVDVGRRVQVQMRATAPRGMGLPNSAPKPPPTVVSKLTEHITPRNGHAPVHLMTRSTASNPAAVRALGHGTPSGAAPNAMTGTPGNETKQPATEPARHRATSQPGPNSMTGPSGNEAQPPGGEPTHHRPPGQPSSNPNTMTGPGPAGAGNEAKPPNGEPTRHHPPGQPNGGPNSMMGPGPGGPGNEAQPPNGEPTQHRPSGQPSGGGNSMMGPGPGGPGNEAQPVGSEPTHHHPSGQPSGGPNSMMGPGGEAGAPKAPAPSSEPRAPNGQPQPNHKKKEPTPESTPPNR